MNLVRSQAIEANEYIFDLCPLLQSQSLLASTSSRSVYQLDKETFKSRHVYKAAHNDLITSLNAFKLNSEEFISTSKDGTIKFWDTRQKHPVRSIRTPEGVGVLCLDTNSDTAKFAVGLELYNSKTGSEAAVQVYDVRGKDSPIVNYTDSHNEDVTTVRFHPSPSSSLLLSGSVDGLVNLYDSCIPDEDDAVLQVLNHGSSIHLAEFIGKNEVLAISHMESGSLYRLSYANEGEPRNLGSKEGESDTVLEYGDLRDSLNLTYCISTSLTASNSYKAGHGSLLFSGRNDGILSIIPFSTSKNGFNCAERIDIEAGHEEIVRSVYLDSNPSREQGELLFAGSEDGHVRVYARSSTTSLNDFEKDDKERKREKKAKRVDETDVERAARKEKKKEKRERRESKSEGRFHPY